MLIRIVRFVVLTCTVARMAYGIQYSINPNSESVDEKPVSKDSHNTTKGSEQDESEHETEVEKSIEEAKEKNILNEALQIVLDPESVITNTKEVDNSIKSILDDIARANQSLNVFMESMDKLSLDVCEKSQESIWSYVSDSHNEEKKKKMITIADQEDEIKRQYWNMLKIKYLNEYLLVTNKKLKRKFRIIRERGTNVQIPQSEQRQEIDSMQRIWSQATVCGYNSTCDPLETRSMSDIISIFKTSNNSQELYYYWKEFRDATGAKIRPIFKKYVKRMNTVAKAENFSDAGEMWRFSLEDEDFVGTATRLWAEVKPLYQVIHEYVRLMLKKHYKEDFSSSDNTLPAHLLGNLWAQEWQAIYPHIAIHPDHLHPSLYETSVPSRRLFDAVDDFHRSLGFHSSVDAYSTVDDSPPPARCLPSSHDMCDGVSYRIKWCGEGNDQLTVALSRAARLLGHVQYFKHYRDLPVLYRDGPTPAFHDAISDIVAIQLTSPAQLKRLGFLQLELTPELSMNHLLWVALEKIPLMAYAYVLDKWRWDVFSGDDQAWNKHWWDLRVGETGISAPAVRSEKDLDPAAKYHVVSHVQYITYLISHVLEFQILLELCKKTNFTGSLHECSLYGSQVAGAFLSKGMSLGASEDWRYVLKTITGQTNISTEGLIKYFQPLHEHLLKEITKLAQGAEVEDMDPTAPIIIGVILVILTAIIIVMFLVKRNNLGFKITKALGLGQNGSMDLPVNEMTEGKQNEVASMVVDGVIEEKV